MLLNATTLTLFSGFLDLILAIALFTAETISSAFDCGLSFTSLELYSNILPDTSSTNTTSTGTVFCVAVVECDVTFTIPFAVFVTVNVSSLYVVVYSGITTSSAL